MAQTAKRRSHSRHHILFQGRHYKVGYAHKLRAAHYFIVRIPSDLHAIIHSKIHDVPTPNGVDCKRAYEELLRRLANGKLNTGKDTIMQRLSFLIEVWEATSPATAAILKYQRDLAGEYYASSD